VSVVVGTPEDVHALAGMEVGSSPWVDVPQESIDGFADLAGDHQWIHRRPRTSRNAPNRDDHCAWLSDVVTTDPSARTGTDNRESHVLDQLRSRQSEVPGRGARGLPLRLTATLAEVTNVDAGVQVKVDCVFHVEGQVRPACVARAVLRHHFAA